MSVRSDQHIVAEADRMVGATAYESVLHDHAASSDLDAPILGADDRAEQDPRLGTDSNVAAEDGCGSDVGRAIDVGA